MALNIQNHISESVLESLVKIQNSLHMITNEIIQWTQLQQKTLNNKKGTFKQIPFFLNQHVICNAYPRNNLFEQNCNGHVIVDSFLLNNLEVPERLKTRKNILTTQNVLVVDFSTWLL
jgi:hypothetical protein